ncbi:type II toxin-antitoxin system VapC family toxin [Chamaesiphon sp. VAR_48_metabat_403]|uniref:type II toxin-antitoxin system VapC family toxin n=1 Tax=Chamaesiphon sp. VAR_48_metabat_403 TaxID=2964700 RepID=UPI00286DF00D|nr:type II toxin-antitoxin system VapC family toxin [Chamaesiphon sp. VAR_48_metabat_403]
MRVLIDTHALLWYLQGDANLSNLALTTIENKDNDVFVSIVSLWEIAIKSGLGKLELQRPFENLEADLQRLDIKILSIAFTELNIYRSLPLHHRDPFDRILIAQSIGNSLTIITRDALFEVYSIRVMW